MAREHLAADGDLLMGERGEARFRIAPFDYLELLQSLLGIALILVGPADLIVMRHRQVVRGHFDLLAGRMHLLEVAQRSDRLGVVLVLVLRKSDLELGVLGVGAERILVDQFLKVDRRTRVIVRGKSLLPQRVIVLAGRSLLMSGTGRHAERETSRQ